jgi:hypothetical protein
MAVINVLSGLLTPLIAIVTTYIMIQQFRIEKRNSRFQLFSPRHQIYNATMIFISKVISEDNANLEILSEYMRETRDSNIFFEEDINDYISQLYKKGHQLRLVNKRLDDNKLGIGEQRNRLAEEGGNISEWFINQNDIAKMKFKPYLNFNRP